MVNLKQDTYTKNKKDKVVCEYDPMCNPEYAKILTAMVDVAEVNKSINIVMGEEVDYVNIKKMKTSKLAQKNVQNQQSMAYMLIL